MRLDRLDAYAQAVRNLFVDPPFSDLLHDLTLAMRQDARERSRLALKELIEKRV
jgi:hypothetical protein